MKKSILVLCILLISTMLSFSQSVIQHIVQRGETKEYLASKYNISVEELMDANPLFTTFYTGISVNIPVKPQITSEEISTTIANSVESIPKTKKKNSFWRFLGQVFAEVLSESVSNANTSSSQAYSPNQGFNYTLPINRTSYVPSGTHFDYAPSMSQINVMNPAPSNLFPKFDYTLPSGPTIEFVDGGAWFTLLGGKRVFVSNEEAMRWAETNNSNQNQTYFGGSTYEERQASRQAEHEALKQKNHDYYKEHYGYKDCHMCRGSGRCQTCNGSGLGNYGECPNCLLLGGKRSGKCSICSGKGKVYGNL